MVEMGGHLFCSCVQSCVLLYVVMDLLLLIHKYYGIDIPGEQDLTFHPIRSIWLHRRSSSRPITWL